MNTTLTFEWDLPQGLGPENIVDYYVIYILPEPLSHPIMNVVSDPPWNVTLQHNVKYSTNITAVNCAGQSETFTYSDIEYSKYCLKPCTCTTVIKFTLLVNCNTPVAPVNGSLRTYLHTREGATVTYQCNDGFRPSRVFTSVCTNTTEWIPPPHLHICSFVTGEALHLHTILQ